MDGDDSSNEYLSTFKSNQAAINRGVNPNRMYKNQSRNNEQYQQHHQLHHWSSSIKEVSVAFGSNKLLNVIFLGGSCDASFIYVASIDHKNVNYKSGYLEEGDIILEVEGEKVSGYILKSFLDKLADLAKDNKPIIFKAVKKGFQPAFN
ncbi:hypothetical protein HELRODRAFT_160640 [Helobdella robusta]|uniref:PDZ domain-containing protein n=1 Tax=Helobdella robusta TaxID=6412 RepID=T1EQJ4_HELRO|nr:hypothetical protein HELRODRAFT_160640 [Helobdella robusta]ESO06469.1 hypothetical protein HELRODRAFT_160640 [Helobdella robusta]